MKAVTWLQHALGGGGGGGKMHSHLLGSGRSELSWLPSSVEPPSGPSPSGRPSGGHASCLRSA